MNAPEKQPINPPPRISIEEFDRRAEDGEGLEEYFDWDHVELIKPGELSSQQKRALGIQATDSEATMGGESELRISLPAWAVDQLKVVAFSEGIPLEDFVQLWIVEQLEQQKVAA